LNYETTQDLYDALSAPFPVEFIEWRIGSTNADKSKGLPLCYVDARAVMDRLDTVCAPDNWQCNYTPGVAGSIVCNLGIRMPSGEWIWKADGAGETQVEAEKGMLSDALKRAAVRWGIGRYLYDLHAAWVEIVDKRIPKETINKLNDMHEDFAQKAGWGMRSGIQAYKLLNQVIKHTVTDAIGAQEFKEKNASMVAQLPVAMRRHLNEQLDRIGA
jgi:hypothetical protein